MKTLYVPTAAIVKAPGSIFDSSYFAKITRRFADCVSRRLAHKRGRTETKMNPRAIVRVISSVKRPSYHNLGMMDEQSLYRDTEWNEIKRTVINSVKGKGRGRMKKKTKKKKRKREIGTTQLFALYLFNLSRYTKLFL